MVLPVLAGTLLLLLAFDRGCRLPLLFTSGIHFGIAILMKRYGAIFTLFAAVCLVWLARQQDRRKLLVVSGGFLAGVATPLGLTCIALAVAGVFHTFWFWTVTYAREYASGIPLAIGLKIFASVLPHIVRPNIPLWILAGTGLVLVWWKKEDRPAAWFATCFLVVSFLAVCPGFYFREHYFVLMLPAVALLASAGVSSLRRPIGERKLGGLDIGEVLSTGLFVAALLVPIMEQSSFFFNLTPLQAVRQMYSLNPFPEAIEVGNYLKANAKPGDRIAVFGSEPEIYFYAQRPAAMGYIYTYGMMEPQRYAVEMQNEMARQIETARPEYVVQVDASGSW